MLAIRYCVCVVRARASIGARSKTCPNTHDWTSRRAETCTLLTLTSTIVPVRPLDVAAEGVKLCLLRRADRLLSLCTAQSVVGVMAQFSPGQPMLVGEIHLRKRQQ